MATLRSAILEAANLLEKRGLIQFKYHDGIVNGKICAYAALALASKEVVDLPEYNMEIPKGGKFFGRMVSKVARVMPELDPSNTEAWKICNWNNRSDQTAKKIASALRKIAYNKHAPS